MNVTIDISLYNELIKFKEKNGVVQLSPLINEMLWDWIKAQKQNDNG